MTYYVSTQHRNQFNGQFICPAMRDELTPEAAAQSRFDRLAPDSKATVTRLLVVDRGTYEGWIYDVHPVEQPAYRLERT